MMRSDEEVVVEIYWVENWVMVECDQVIFEWILVEMMILIYMIGYVQFCQEWIVQIMDGKMKYYFLIEE